MHTLTPYTFGTMSLGKNPIDISRDLAVARRALEAGVWFHSSPTYNNGFSFMVLRELFNEDRSHVPKMVIKVRDGSVQLMRFEVEDSCRRLGIDNVEIAQLVSMDENPGNLVDQLRTGGPLADELASLRQRGLIRKAVIFLTQKNSDAAVAVAESSGLIDGVILYWNACQRDCTDSAWATINEKQIPTLALRTLGGGPADKHSADKAERLAALLSETGSPSLTDFNLRLAASVPVIRTTIGGTASPYHLEEFLSGPSNSELFSAEILAKVSEFQSR